MFIAETMYLRANSQCLLLVLDGYGSHVQFKTLQIFRKNRLVVVALPAHTCHVLQPLDVSVFSSYKSFLQREIHICAQSKKCLDAFEVSFCIKYAYSASMTSSNIASGFERAGIWCGEILSASIEPLKHLFGSTDNGASITLETIVDSFMRCGRSLIRDTDVGDEGTVRANTQSGSI